MTYITISTASASPTALNRGRLNNGNPSGDYMKAPRCGAKTRSAGCCLQPAMANGRCRFHGGKSTGARTAAGRARCARARRTHGFYSAEVVALRNEARTALRRNRDLLAALRGSPAGHGVLRSFSSTTAERPAEKIKPPMNADERGCRRSAADASAAPAHRRSSAFIGGSNFLSALESESHRPIRAPAGHGVLSSVFRFALARAARWLGLQSCARA